MVRYKACESRRKEKIRQKDERLVERTRYKTSGERVK